MLALSCRTNHNTGLKPTLLAQRTQQAWPAQRMPHWQIALNITRLGNMLFGSMIAAYCRDPRRPVRSGGPPLVLSKDSDLEPQQARTSERASELNKCHEHTTRSKQGNISSWGTRFSTQMCKHWDEDTKLTAGLLAPPGRELGSLILRRLTSRWHWTCSIPTSRSPLIGPTTVVSSPLTNSRYPGWRGQGDEVGLPTSTWDHLGTLHRHLSASLTAVYEPRRRTIELAKKQITCHAFRTLEAEREKKLDDDIAAARKRKQEEQERRQKWYDWKMNNVRAEATKAKSQMEPSTRHTSTAWHETVAAKARAGRAPYGLGSSGSNGDASFLTWQVRQWRVEGGGQSGGQSGSRGGGRVLWLNRQQSLALDRLAAAEGAKKVTHIFFVWSPAY
ncbi:hypothetical protein PG985_002752 [Apiospora marii]|uniref:uncharacterized protein n=1 Tax=Apiospora marii TaxID=335849 RepID=UPI0031313785